MESNPLVVADDFRCVEKLHMEDFLIYHSSAFFCIAAQLVEKTAKGNRRDPREESFAGYA